MEASTGLICTFPTTKEFANLWDLAILLLWQRGWACVDLVLYPYTIHCRAPA